MKPKALVTGASGMLGRSLLRRWRDRFEVVGTSRSGPNACDLRDRSQTATLVQKLSPEIIIHTAAFSDVDDCEKDTLLAQETNAIAPQYLAEIRSQKKIPLVHVSTDYVFDGHKRTPYEENDATFPVNVYGLTKLGGEYHVRQAGGRSTIVRTSWLFGPETPSNFVNAIIARLQSQDLVKVLDDQRDCPTHVDDLSDALEAIAQDLLASSSKKQTDIYHFCNQGGTTRYDMTAKIRDLMGLKNVRVETLERESVQGRLAVRPAFNEMSTKRYQEKFKVSIRPWADALRDYLRQIGLCAS